MAYTEGEKATYCYIGKMESLYAIFLPYKAYIGIFKGNSKSPVEEFSDYFIRVTIAEICPITNAQNT
jgi:hypothetical protein